MRVPSGAADRRRDRRPLNSSTSRRRSRPSSSAKSECRVRPPANSRWANRAIRSAAPTHRLRPTPPDTARTPARGTAAQRNRAKSAPVARHATILSVRARPAFSDRRGRALPNASHAAPSSRGTGVRTHAEHSSAPIEMAAARSLRELRSRRLRLGARDHGIARAWSRPRARPAAAHRGSRPEPAASACMQLIGSSAFLSEARVGAR